MISGVYPPAIGGQEREVKLLSEGLAKSGKCDVIVCTLKHGFQKDFEEMNNVEVNRLSGAFQRLPFLFSDPQRRYCPPFKDPVLTRNIERIILAERPDVVHTHDWMLFSVLPLRKKLNFALVVTFHDFGFICPTRWSSKHPGGICDRPLTFECIKCGRSVYGSAKSVFAYLGLRFNQNFICDAIVFTNPNLGKYMPNCAPKTYIGHPIDTEEYRPIQTAVHNDRIMIWTKLDKMKGIDLIFDIARHLRNFTFDVPFIGEDRQHYGRIRPNNVTLIPAIDKDQIPDVINRYPLIVGQVHVGVFGHAELEAMSCGKPVVSYWRRKYDEFYDEPCPILSSNNAEDAAHLIESNLGNKELGKRSRQWVLKNHDVSQVTRRLHFTYEKAICDSLDRKSI